MFIVSVRGALFFLRLFLQFVGSPYFLFECIVNSKKKKHLLDDYSTKGTTIVGVIVQQQTTVYRRWGFETGRSYKILYGYKAPGSGSIVVRPVVKVGSEVASRNILLQILPDFPKSGYPKRYIDLRRTDTFDRSCMECKAVLYLMAMMILSFFVAFFFSAAIFDPHFFDDPDEHKNQAYPSCLDEDGPICHMGIAYLLTLPLLASIGYACSQPIIQKMEVIYA